MEFLQTPVGMGIAGGAALLLLFVFLRGRGGGMGAPKAKPDTQMEKLARKGDYKGAAMLAQRAEDFEAALEYYLRGQMPGQAARAATRLGRFRQAAELYERAKQYESAAQMYDKAGMADKANDLRRKSGTTELGFASFKTTSDPPARDTQVSRGKTLDAEFRALLAAAGDNTAEKAEAQRAGRAAAEALLAEGDMRAAAMAYRDAGLEDEAIHMLVNILGSPGEAAPILAARGDHKRAAELYELAGLKERAAATWCEVASNDSHPEAYVERIEALSEAIVAQFFERETRVRPLSGDHVELHYRYGDFLERHGEHDRALQTFTGIASAVGEYKDVAKRVQVLRQPRAVQPSSNEGQRPTEPAGPATAADPAGPRVALTQSELQELAMQVARAAAEQLKHADPMQQLMAAAAKSTQEGAAKTAPRVVVAGLEAAPVRMELLADSNVDAAKEGPSIETLLTFISGKPCELQNIEVYYRLGLAYVARGDWRRALEAFDQVEEASPGYRDAYKRADQIRGWQAAVGDHLTGLGFEKKSSAGDSRYRLLGELGRGGMAVVYRAVDTRLGREVALKFLSQELSSQDGMQEMFEREARSVAQLNHPNIVTIHDYGVLEGRSFICMEFVEGRPVDALLDEDSGITIVEALQIIKQALAALAYAHQRKIIHRDIKPANIMRTSAGLVKLMDFGLAKSLDAGTDSSFVAGTPAYMPPEQLSGRGVDHRVDIFAIGVTLYEMLTAKLPFEGLSRQPPLPLSHHVPAIPSIINDTVMRAINLDPNRRFQSAAEMALPLEQIIEAVQKYSGGTPMVTATRPKDRSVESAATEFLE